MPAVIKNYGLAAAGVPFGLYLGSSILITGTYAVALILLGESLFEHALARFVAIGAVIILVALLCLRWVGRAPGLLQ